LRLGSEKIGYFDRLEQNGQSAVVGLLQY